LRKPPRQTAADPAHVPAALGRRLTQDSRNNSGNFATFAAMRRACLFDPNQSSD